MADGPAAFVVGDPVGHSRSPAIHAAWLAEHGIAGRYDACGVTPAGFSSFIAALKGKDAAYVGGNVTIPYKERICELVDRIDPLVEDLGAANTLWRDDGLLCATNTDVYGFLANLDDRAPNWCVSDRPAVVLGAGGASRAVVRALIERNYRDIRLVNRTVGRARRLADRFGPTVTPHALEAIDEVMAGAGLFVNTTSLGMDGRSGGPKPDFTLLDPAATVTDIVYVPLTTPFLRQASACGLTTIDGLGMLLHQAVPGFERWFGVRPKVTDALRARVAASLEISG